MTPNARSACMWFALLGACSAATTPPTGVRPANRGRASETPLRVTAGELRIEGQVIGPQHDPIEGARVTLHATADEDLTPSETLAETKSEADGSFAFDSLAPGHYTVLVHHHQIVTTSTFTLAVDSDPVVIRID